LPAHMPPEHPVPRPSVPLFPSYDMILPWRIPSFSPYRGYLLLLEGYAFFYPGVINFHNF
ncbi:MAG: hypothetical protein R6V59_02680, partial [Dehalococcoidia bacterium]